MFERFLGRQPGMTEDKPAQQEVERNDIGITEVIQIMRHGTKENADKPDELIRLSPYGKFQALNKAFQSEPMTSAVGRGSLRERTLETAGIASLAESLTDDISQATGVSKSEIPDLVAEIVSKKGADLSEKAALVFAQADRMSLEALEEKLEPITDKDGNVINWIDKDPRLNFNIDNNTNFGRNFYARFKAGNAMRYLVDEGDREAIEDKDKLTSGYSKMSGNVADLLLGYAETIGELKNFMKTNQTNTQSYDKIKKDNQYVFNRVFATHATVGQSFVVKAFEIVFGKESRDEIIEKVPNGGAETDGPRIEITSHGDADPEITMTLPDSWVPKEGKTIKLTADILRKMVADRDDLERKIEAGN